MENQYRNKLILILASSLAIPNGGGLADGIKFLTDEGYRKKILNRATKITNDAITAVKHAPDNQWGLDDEVIAQHLLEEIKKKRTQHL